MRNFFKNKLARAEKITRKEIADILDTDEDRVINQYRGYLSYINSVKREILRKSAEFIGYAKRPTMATHGSR